MKVYLFFNLTGSIKMTVLDKRESSDEDSNKSRKKIRFSGCLNGENPRRAWLTDKTLAKPPTKIRYFG